MLSLVRTLFGALCLIKTVDLADRLPEVLAPPTAWIVVGGWLLSAILLAAGTWPRPALAGILLTGSASFLLTDFAVYNQHMALIVSMALIMLLFRPAEQVLLLKAQLSVVYAFAALTKLNGAFLSGARLEMDMVPRPFGRAIGMESLDLATLLPMIAVASVAIEAFLAFGFWFGRTRIAALIVGAGFHAAMLLFMTVDLLSFVRLGVFGGLMAVLYLPFFDSEEAGQPGLAQTGAAVAGVIGR